MERRWILVEQLKNPMSLEVAGNCSQFGKDPGHQVMELVDQPDGLAGLGFEAAGDLAEGDQFGRYLEGWFGVFPQGEAPSTVAFHGIGFALGEDGLAILLVTCGLTDRNGFREGKLAEECFEVAGVLAGGIDADAEENVGNTLGELLELLLQELVAFTRFGEFAGRGGRLQIFAEEGDMMSIACGVKADADGGQRWSDILEVHNKLLLNRDKAGWQPRASSE